MDLPSLLGPLIAVGMLVAGILLKHAGALIPTILWNPPSVAIVIGGTIGALMVAYPLPDFINAFKSLSKFLKNPEANREEILNQIIELAQIARKESILALEKRRDSITFPPPAQSCEARCRQNRPCGSRRYARNRSSLRNGRS